MVAPAMLESFAAYREEFGDRLPIDMMWAIYGSVLNPSNMVNTEDMINLFKAKVFIQVLELWLTSNGV